MTLPLMQQLARRRQWVVVEFDPETGERRKATAQARMKPRQAQVRMDPQAAEIIYTSTQDAGLWRKVGNSVAAVVADPLCDRHWLEMGNLRLHPSLFGIVTAVIRRLGIVF